MANWFIALRYSNPFLPGLEDKYGKDIQGVEAPEVNGRGYRYFEHVIKIKGNAKRAIEKVRAYEQSKRMIYMTVIYILKHYDHERLDQEYRRQLHEALKNSDTILIEPKSVCKYVVKTLDFGYYFYLSCAILTGSSIFIGKFYKHKTFTAFALFMSGALLTMVYSGTYETWPIADFCLYPDALLVGSYCSPAVIFIQPDPIAIYRYYDRYGRINLLYTLNLLAGAQLLYRFYQGVPPFLCPCTSIHFPENPRYAFGLYPVVLLIGCVFSAINSIGRYIFFG